MTCFLLLARLGVQPREGFSLHPWNPNCARIMGILGNVLVGWPYSSQMAQGEIFQGSAVAFAFFPLALFGWGGAGAGAMIGFCGSGGG